MTDTSLYDEWMAQRGWRKLFMPRHSSTKWNPGETETVLAGRTVVQEMKFEDKRERKQVLPKDVDGYSTNFGYIPDTFINGRITLLEDHTVLDCGKCDGAGELPCPEEQTCGRCKGKGRTSRRCRDCRATGTQTRSSRTSHKDTGVFGDTEWGSSTTTSEVDCRSCDGSGWISERCGSCRETGAVRCGKCKGKGYLTCKKCEGGGEVVDAQLLHRHFTSTTSQTSDEKRVPVKYLKGLLGTPIEENDEVPKGLVKRLETVEGFPTKIQHCAFGKREFQILKIKGGDETRFRAPGHPWIWHTLFS